MLSTRNVIIATVVIAVVSLVGVIVELAQPPDSGGLGRDTYGTRAHGLRALYEILEELDLPARRALVPPSAFFQEDVCIVFWAPDPAMVRIEPGHLQQTSQWIREGGRVLVAPARETESRPSGPSPSGADKFHRDTSALAELGLPEVSVTSADRLEGRGDTEEKEDSQEPHRNVARGFRSAPQERPTAYRTVSASADGELAFLGGAVASLSVPDGDLRVIDPSSKPEPSGRVFLRSGGREHDIVALYSMGRGEIVVVSDPELFLNRSIAEEDNAVLAVDLLGCLGGRAVFDEFYHGLTVRGNPVWLLTRHPYGLFVALLLAATALWVWREWVHLGPPLPAGPARRRDIGEYVDAMARLFHRSGHRRFILGELRGGVLWALRKKLHLSPRQETPESIARAVARRDTEAAERLRSAAADVDALLGRKREPSLNAMVRVAKEMTRCL